MLSDFEMKRKMEKCFSRSGKVFQIKYVNKTVSCVCDPRYDNVWMLANDLEKSCKNVFN